MWTLIIGLIIIGIAVTLIKEYPHVVIPIIVLIIVFNLFGLQGVLATIVILALIVGVLALVGYVRETLENHDRNKKETAKINYAIQVRKELSENEAALLEELNLNCRWLGYMNEEMWKKKLANYAEKKYVTSFNEITENFAKQTEQQYITQNDGWFQPFLMYIIDHPQGTTPIKMLNEVSCSQLNATHFTSNLELLQRKLRKGTQRISKDVPPLFEEIALTEISGCLYVPTKYALKLYGREKQTQETFSSQEEINFSEL